MLGFGDLGLVMVMLRFTDPLIFMGNPVLVAGNPVLPHFEESG